MSDIQYLLNAFEEASQHADPASVGYGEKRKALLDRLAELESEIEALRKDAERYRWLRSRDLETIDKGGVFAGMTPRNVVLNEEHLDSAIDAALKEQSKC